MIPAPSHVPVLLETIRRIAAEAGARRIVDGTLGHGGHAEMFLALGAEVLGIDRDPEALAIARERLGARLQTVEAAYGSEEAIAAVTAFRPEMAVHGRYRKPCPTCGAPVQRIVYAANETNYCANCQTEGKVLADRSLSRLLKSDWPRTLDELEALKRR